MSNDFTALKYEDASKARARGFATGVYTNVHDLAKRSATTHCNSYAHF